MTANQGASVQRRRFAAGVAAVALGVAGCGGASSSGHATASAGRPLQIYRVVMSGRAETPHGALHGVGSAVIAIHARSVLCWRFAHLHGFASATVAHIHTGRPGRSGPVLVALSTAPALHHQGCTHATAAAITAIERNPRGFYVNVHSARYPAGAVRGQL